MSPLWRGMLIGAGLTLLGVVLVGIFLAYQQPALLLDWANLRMCN